jgi:class 3 adenylate cyclase
MSEEPSALHSDERRLAPILVADVAGYSRLMGRNEDETVRDLVDGESEPLVGPTNPPGSPSGPIPALWPCLH